MANKKSKEAALRELSGECSVHRAMLDGRHWEPKNKMEAYAFEWHKITRLLFGMAQIPTKEFTVSNKPFKHAAKSLRDSINSFLE